MGADTCPPACLSGNSIRPVASARMRTTGLDDTGTEGSGLLSGKERGAGLRRERGVRGDAQHQIEVLYRRTRRTLAEIVVDGDEHGLRGLVIGEDMHAHAVTVSVAVKIQLRR